MNQLDKIHNELFQYSGGVINYLEINLSLLTAHSTRIESSMLSTDEVINLIQNNQVTEKVSFIHHLMVKDHQEALLKVLDFAQKKEKITIEKIKLLSTLIIKNTGLEFVETIFGKIKLLEGDYRLGSASAGTRQFVDFRKIPDLMNLLVEDINSNIDKLKTKEEIYEFAFKAHYQVVNIHPFVDGNGRLARLLMNYVEAYHNQPFTAIDSENKIAYYYALNETKNQEDISIFIDFMFLEHIKFIKNQIEQIKLNYKQENKLKINKTGNVNFNLLF